MSAGRKVVVTLTQAEASVLLRAIGDLKQHHNWTNLECAVSKIAHQLAAVQGRLVKS